MIAKKLGISWLRRSAMRRLGTPLSSAGVSSVALIELTGLGDVVSMLPALRGMQSLFPAAELHLVVDEQLTGLLKAFDLPCTIHGVAQVRSKSGTVAAIRLVRCLGLTLACSMSPPRRNALVALASGAPCIAGYLRYTDSLTPYLIETPVEGFGLTLVRKASYGRENIGERALKVCRALGMRDDPPELFLTVSPSIARIVQPKLLADGVPPDGDFVVIHPFAGWTYRTWPLESFADLAERLAGAVNANVVFLWEGKKEGDLPGLRRRFAHNDRIRFASSLSLLESAMLIAGAELFIGNDSGPLHLAAALGVPAVGLFGPSDPSLTAPRTSRPAAWVYNAVDCSPCDQRTCVRPGDPCMRMISVEEVASKSISVHRAGEVRRSGSHA